MSTITLVAQIFGKLDSAKLKKLLAKHQTDKHPKGFSRHLVSTLFCQFAKSQSVRYISNSLRCATGNLNYLGRVPSKSTISYQNKHRNYEVFKDYYFELFKSLGQ